MFKLQQLFCNPRAHVLCPGARILRGRMRAQGEEEKQARREAILDAAGSLFSERHQIANVADIAAAAGLAKGTVYLYFPTKEAIYMALHLRHCAQFFQPLLERLAQTEPLQFDELMALTNRHILAAPDYLPLGAHCNGFAENAVPPEAIADFQAQLNSWLVSAGAGIERHFPRVAAGDGASLLHHSYALMVGLFSLMRGGSGAPATAARQCVQIPGMGDFIQEAQRALTRYWTLAVGEAPPAPLSPAFKEHSP
jgi:AcrR family transcriptional regulator